jgi:hypothetical protein
MGTTGPLYLKAGRLLCRRMALWGLTAPVQSSARRRLPFQPRQWPSDTSKRIQSRFPSFRVHVRLRPPGSYPIPPLLPHMAESTLKVSQMLVLNHF